MKSTFSKKQKHSITLQILICISIIILLIVIMNRYTEKFAPPVGKYEYLAPVKDTINDEMWQILFSKMEKNGVAVGLSLEILKNTYTKFITKKEINYYLDNNIFPWNPYVSNLFKEFISGIKENPENLSIDELLNKNMKKMPNRYAYSQYLLTPDMKESLKNDSYLIYNGEKTILF